MSQIDTIRAGLLAAWNAGDVDDITWVSFPAPGGYTLFGAAESLSVGGLRMPASFNEEIAMSTGIGIVPMTNEIQDARLAAAPIIGTRGIAITEDGPPVGAGETGDPEQVLRFNRRMGPIGKTLREGEAKRWTVRPDLAPGQVVNRGFRKADGSLYQKGIQISTAHNADYGVKGGAYSQQFAPTARYALKNGKPVDLLDELAVGGPLGKFPPWLVQRLRGTRGAVA